MKFSIKYILLVCAIAYTAGVSAKAPPGHGVVQEPKKEVCPGTHFINGSTTQVVAPLSRMELICYIEPVKIWVYVDVVVPIYHAPYVARVDAFYARSSC